MARRGASPATTATTGQTQARPNIVLIVADDLNTRLGTYGYAVRTPNIDALARGSAHAVLRHVSAGAPDDGAFIIVAEQEAPGTAMLHVAIGTTGLPQQ